MRYIKLYSEENQKNLPQNQLRETLISYEVMGKWDLIAFNYNSPNIPNIKYNSLIRL